MDISNNTILITGGSAGIGLSFAKELLEKGNTVIICGRNESRLQMAKKSHPKLHTITCDVSDEIAIQAMVKKLVMDFPQLNMLINNAGLMHIHDVANQSLALQHQKNEIQTNFFGVVALCDALIPHLKTQPQASIVNVSSGLAYMPFLAAPVYTATKAAIHSYTQSIRQALKSTPITVFEVLPPMVDTQMSHGLEMQGMKKLSSEDMARFVVKKLKQGKLEIRPGAAAMMIKMYKLFPGLINLMMAKMAPAMLKDLPTY